MALTEQGLRCVRPQEEGRSPVRRDPVGKRGRLLKRGSEGTEKGLGYGKRHCWPL